MMIYDDETKDFNNWCTNYFGPDSDEQYVLDAVKKCPIVKRLQSRLEKAENEAARYAKLPINEWQELEYWLDRCYNKGHLEQCSDLIEPYHNLSNAIAAMQSAKESQ